MYVCYKSCYFLVIHKCACDKSCSLTLHEHHPIPPPNTHRTQQAWDVDTKSCKQIVANAGGRAAMVSELQAPAAERKSPRGTALRPLPEVGGCTRRIQFMTP